MLIFLAYPMAPIFVLLYAPITYFVVMGALLSAYLLYFNLNEEGRNASWSDRLQEMWFAVIWPFTAFMLLILLLGLLILPCEKYGHKLVRLIQSY